MAQKTLRERIIDSGLSSVKDVSNLLSLAVLDGNKEDIRLCYEKSLERMRNREFEYHDVYRASMKALAYDDFDIYCQYLELDRPAYKRF